MLKIFLTPQAILDLELIFEFTFLSSGHLQAENYQDDFYDHFKNISHNPEIGSIYIYKKGDYRKLKCNKHLIFYKIENSKCIIVRILHEKIDLNSELE